MSTALFFVMVGVLAVYGLCEGIVRFVSWLWLPKEMKAVTFVRCDDERALTPLCRELWEEKTGHLVVFWTLGESDEKNGRISLSNVPEILLFSTE